MTGGKPAYAGDLAEFQNAVERFMAVSQTGRAAAIQSAGISDPQLHQRFVAVVRTTLGPR